MIRVQRSNMAEQVGDEARFMHQGMTSSDVLDTTLSLQLVKDRKSVV